MSKLLLSNEKERERRISLFRLFVDWICGNLEIIRLIFFFFFIPKVKKIPFLNCTENFNI